MYIQGIQGLPIYIQIGVKSEPKNTKTCPNHVHVSMCKFQILVFRKTSFLISFYLYMTPNTCPNHVYVWRSNFPKLVFRKKTTNVSSFYWYMGPCWSKTCHFQGPNSKTKFSGENREQTISTSSCYWYMDPKRSQTCPFFKVPIPNNVSL